MPTLVPLHVEHTGSFVLPMKWQEAFPLFTAEGERRWVPGWNPEYLHPNRPANGAGTVFRTNIVDEETLWIVLDYDPAAGVARYARITPGSRLGTVRVRCEPEEDTTTRVTVTYALTASSDAGNAVLASFTPDAYRTMLNQWREMILESASEGEHT